MTPLIKNRILSLDGLRGIAILSVIFYHYYNLSPISSQYYFPYGLVYSSYIVFEYGYLGVMLFFSISGFVITQTLHNSMNPIEFILKRFSRLWPAMFICCLTTYLISFIPPFNYLSSFSYFLPSLTFIDPKIFNAIFRSDNYGWMDNSYWSLFTEVRFYALTAFIFYFNKTNFHKNLLNISLLIGLALPIGIFFQFNLIVTALKFFVIANNLPWFIMGVGFYYLYIGRNKIFINFSIVSILSLALYIIISVHIHSLILDPYAEGFGGLIIFSLMYSSLKINKVIKILSFKPLGRLGVASYSLYLLHQNIGEKIILSFGNPFKMNEFFCGLYVIVPLLSLILISQIIYKYIEKPINIFLIDKYKLYTK